MTPTNPTPRTRSRLRRTVRPAVLFVAAGALLAAAPAVFAGATPGAVASGAAAKSCILAFQPPLAVDHERQPLPARLVLQRLAERLHAVPADTQTGLYAYNAVQMQAADSTLDSPCVQTVTAYATKQHWRAANDSGQVTSIPWHHDPANPPPSDTTYPTGALLGVVPDPVPTDPAVLAAALDAAYPPSDSATLAQPLHADDTIRQRRLTGTAARLRAVADLNAWSYTNRDARRAVLLVLADIAGLDYRRSVAGYPNAIAVSADSGDWRDLLVINLASGAVLAYEQVLLRNGAQLGVHTPYSNARTTYTASGRTPQAGQAPA